MPSSENAHALLSASAAERWMNCTAAPRYEAQFPENTTEYAEEGRVAHSLCELKVLKKFTTRFTPRQYTDKLRKLKKDPLYSAEMDRTSDFYVEYIVEKAMENNAFPLVEAEVRVDFAEYVPGGFGTCDCVLISGDTLNIFDYKHGKGIPVSSIDNPQMRLYALGALAKYAPFYGGIIHQVCMTIIQPRIRDDPTSETLTLDELKAWGESIKPLAQKAFSGFGEFISGEHCRFCRGKAQCRARAHAHTSLEEFKNHLTQTPADAEISSSAPILTHVEIGDLLVRGKTLLAWYNDLENYALNAVLSGEDIPGWKVVSGRSNRTFSDQDAAATAVIESGYDASLVYERKLKTLTALEELMGKKAFAEKLGAYVIKPPGKPTLAPFSDKREPYSPAAADFAEILN